MSRPPEGFPGARAERPPIRFVDLGPADRGDARSELVRGLLDEPARISPKYFYDKLGSHLFAAITELAEYYPPRCERAILEEQGAALAGEVHRRLGSAPTLVDLGAGDCAKAASLFPTLRPARYVAVDISSAFLREALQDLQRRFPDIELTGVGVDFSTRLQLPVEVTGQDPSLVFYPGSSIGNFAPDEAVRLLSEAREASRGGLLLIGVDLVKPRAVLEPAYDDAIGVTAAFNLNVLRHVNRLVDGDFDPAGWRHVAFFDEAASRIEMHLEARREQAVTWAGGRRVFPAGARIHTENSHKWTREGFDALLARAGWRTLQSHTDARGWFAVVLAAAA